MQDGHDRNTGYRGSDSKLSQFATGGGWKKGPALLTSTGERFWDNNGVNMAGWHGWPSTMQEYDGKAFMFDYGGSMGYRLNAQLRAGERLTRNWFNKGLYVNMLDGDNKITFSAGPHEGTVTLEGATNVAFRDKGRSLFYRDFHSVLTGDVRTDGMQVNASGQVVR
jgi:hypothetical protein